jgi:tetrahydromethanopterin S-methyltransferase subunit G
MGRDEEETFKLKEKRIEIEKIDESKVNSIMERLELITEQVNLISGYLLNVSKKVNKSIDASATYQRDLDNLERKIESIKSKLEDLENVVPEVQLERKVGRRAG